ncbi:uncharacterized protein LOC127704390 [Mytilus californianus]|uniref:uncharacterized protein LOC127704390 n=1 Tax=Mytilus californianus TaxID=6549 RepID=UPI002247E293|nr:uncharacterized protein LOC127704390 [Mytilus californianus]
MNNVRKIAFIINVYLFVFKAESQVESRLSLSAEPEEFHYITNVTFKCQSSIETTDCSADFLYNNISIDSLKAVNGSCYHIQGLCNTKKCTCHNDCKIFTLTVTNTNYTTGEIISCRVHYNSNGFIHSMTATIIYNTNKFSQVNTTFGVVAKPDESSSSNTDPNNGNSSEKDVVVVILVAVFVVIVIGVFICLLLRMRKKESPRNKPKCNQTRESTVTDNWSDKGKGCYEFLFPISASSEFDATGTVLDKKNKRTVLYSADTETATSEFDVRETGEDIVLGDAVVCYVITSLMYF